MNISETLAYVYAVFFDICRTVIKSIIVFNYIDVDVFL